MTATEITFSRSEYGDHPAGACEAMRVTYDIERAKRRPDPDIVAFAIGGYHAGWGICAGRVGAPASHRARCAHPTVSPWVRSAQSSALPAKDMTGAIR